MSLPIIRLGLGHDTTFVAIGLQYRDDIAGQQNQLDIIRISAKRILTSLRVEHINQNMPIFPIYLESFAKCIDIKYV